MTTTTHPRPKDVGIAYLLWFLLGGAGAHRFYLRRTGSAAAQLCLLVAGLLTGFVTWFPLALWWLVDAFLLAGMVRQHNETIEQGDQDSVEA